MKRKNLERAIVLGLVALSLHGVALAADEYVDYTNLSDAEAKEFNSNFGDWVLNDRQGMLVGTNFYKLQYQTDKKKIWHDDKSSQNIRISGHGILLGSEGNLDLKAGDILIETTKGLPPMSKDSYKGIYVNTSDEDELAIGKITANDIIIKNSMTNISDCGGIWMEGPDYLNNTHNKSAGNTLDINANNLQIENYLKGMYLRGNNKLTINVNENIIMNSTHDRNDTEGIHQNSFSVETDDKGEIYNNINISAGKNIALNDYTYGIYAENNSRHLTLTAKENIEIHGRDDKKGDTGIASLWNNIENKDYKNNKIIFDAGKNIIIDNYDKGAEVRAGGLLSLNADEIVVQNVTQGFKTYGSNTDAILDANNILINAQEMGIDSDGESRVKIDGSISIISLEKGISAETSSSVDLTGDNVNISADKVGVEITSEAKGNIEGNTIIKSDKDAITVYDSNSTLNINIETEDNTTIVGNMFASKNGELKIGNGSFVEGNFISANNGNAELEVTGSFTGRVDDYSVNKNKKLFGDEFNTSFFISKGTATLNMSENSIWNVAGQSWVTNLTMDNSVVNMTDVNNTNTGNAVTVGKISGTGTFNMSLNHDDHFNSDMLYIKGGSGKFNVDVDDVTGNLPLTADEKLRFATVGNKDIKFDNISISGQGIYDLQMGVFNEDYKVDDAENESYNGKELDTQKPGNANIDKDFGKDGATNWYISGVKKQEETPSADVIVDMSRANYSNAVYMDRLNKRMGEMRYINDEEDTGLWVRMRHDRVGKDDAFKYKSNMYEIGYDEKQECDNGERRVGVAIDYMHGDTTYSNVGGKGEISRKGVWLYDTWLGDKGHYADYVAKWGHLANDYEIYNLKNGDKITGDYDNNVFSLSAEYGRKKDMGSNWYIEPQAQLQYAYVTDADYRTTQGTDVSLDSIHSLIGRAGFRLGKDTDERSTIYFKADLLHEFLGDQDIYARDKTGEMCKTYDNKGTWYDMGFGFATALNKDSYLYADFERSFGNDNDNTWQVNVGANWSF